MTAAGWNFAGSTAPSYRGLRPPSKLLWLAEYRAFWEIGFALAASPLLLTAPRGDGHPVLVLPGFLVSDISTSLRVTHIYGVGQPQELTIMGWRQGRKEIGAISRDFGFTS